MRRWPFVLAGLVGLVVIAGVAGLPIVEERLAGQVKARLEQGEGTKVEKVEVNLLQRRLVLHEFTLAQGADSTLRLLRLDVHGLGWPLSDLIAGRTPFAGWKWGDPFQAEQIEIDEFELVHALEGEWRAAKVIADDIDLPRHEQSASAPQDGVVRQAVAFANLSVRRFEQRDFSYQPPDEYGVAVKIGNVMVEGLDKGRIRSVALTGTEVRDYPTRPPAWLSLAAIGLRNVDLAVQLRRMRDPDWLPGMPLGRVWFEAFTLDGVGGDALADLAVSLGKVSYEARRDGDKSRGRTTIEGFALRPQGLNSDSAATLAVLLALGVREVTAELACDSSADRDKNEVTLERCLLTSPGLAELEWSLKFINADETFWRAFDEGDMFLMLTSKIGLGAGKLVVRDQSLLDRLVGFYATSNGVSRPEARAAVAREVRRFQPTDVLITEDMTKLADTVARFVEQGGVLTIDARPDPPVTFDDTRAFFGLGPGPDIVSLFGMSASLSKR